MPSLPGGGVSVFEPFHIRAIIYLHFTPGAPSVGGPIEIAAITKHEGFKKSVDTHRSLHF
jgi:hypothetical protein